MVNNKLAIEKEAVEKFGTDAQLWMVIEEMSELSKEVCKYIRGYENQEHIAEEIADVQIMLDQLQIVCGVDSEMVEAFTNSKLERLAKLIGME